MPASKASSVARAARWPDRTAEKVAIANTRVPAAVAAEAAVAQSIVAQSIIDVSCHPGVEIEEPRKLKSLYLLRHAKSSWDKPDLADHDRPLARRGREAARRMAVHMRQAKVRPTLVLCSSAIRAVQTYRAIAPALGPSVELSVEDALYGASWADLLERLQVLPEQVGTVLLIGHNPAMHELAIELAGDGGAGAVAQLVEKFPTGALASLDVPGRWEALGAGLAYVQSLTVPRDLSS